MTTRINVTVGDGGLLDRNAQQQAANRQGYVVRSEQNKAVAQGEAELEQRRTAEGLDPSTGRPLSSAAFASRLIRIDQEPAAFRIIEDYYIAQLRDLQIRQTQQGLIYLDLVTENGTAYTFNLASTFAYPSGDDPSTGIGTVDLLEYSYLAYNPPGLEDEPLIDFYSNKSLEVAAEPPPWGNSFSRDIIYPKGVIVAPAPASLTVMLPLRKDVFILASAGKGTRFRFAATQVKTEAHNYVQYEDENFGILYRHDWVDSWTSDVSEQLDKYQWCKCFYVTKSVCKEISVPATLYGMLEDYLSDFDVSVAWQYDTSLFVISRIDGVESVGTHGDKLEPVATLSRSVSTPARFSDRFRLSGFLATNDGPYIATPGIYKALQLSADDTRFLDPRDPVLTDIAYMVNNFYEGSYANLPKFGLQSVYEFLPDYEPKYYGHYRTKNRPIYNRNLIGDELINLKNRTKVRTSTLNLLAWDWNNPVYCRQQLLSLGFSPTDLDP